MRVSSGEGFARELFYLDSNFEAQSDMAGSESAAAKDFKSLASAGFATSASRAVLS
jgi:hypothetical protein